MANHRLKQSTMAKKKTHFKVQHPDGRTFNIHNDLKDTVKDLMAKGDHEGLERLMDEHHTPEAKSGIHIKESKKGTFTAAAKKRGKGVQEFASQVLAHKENYSSAMVKKANFARNAAKWKHEYGGYVQPREGAETLLDVRAADGMQVQQGDQQQQMQQLMQMVAQALQQGQDPNQVLQMLVQQGVPQDVAQQVIQMVMQQMQGQQQQQPQEQEMQQEQPAMEDGGEVEMAKSGKWIQKAVNPKHKGYCTPMTKKTCTPRRKALARTFKKHHGFHKAEDGMQMQQQQPIAQGTPEQGGQKQMEQLMAMVAQALQQGASPEQVLQMLVQQGVPQQVAQQVIAQVMQQLQGAQQQQPQEEMQQAPQGAMGIRIKKAALGTGVGALNPAENALNQSGFSAEIPTRQFSNAGLPMYLQGQLTPPLQKGQISIPDARLTNYGNVGTAEQQEQQTQQSQIKYPPSYYGYKGPSFPGYLGQAIQEGSENKYYRDMAEKEKDPELKAKYQKMAKATGFTTATSALGAAFNEALPGALSYFSGQKQLANQRKDILQSESLHRNLAYEDSLANRRGGFQGGPAMGKYGKKLPCANCGKRMAYGGKLGFIAENGTELPTHGMDFKSSNPNVNAEGGGKGKYKQGEVIAEKGTKTVTNLTGAPTHDEQDNGAEKVNLNLAEGSVVIPQHLRGSLSYFLDKFKDSPKIQNDLLRNYGEGVAFAANGTMVGKGTADEPILSWAHVADMYHTTEADEYNDLSNQEELLHSAAAKASKKPAKTIAELQPYLGNKVDTRISETTDKLNTRFAKDKLHDIGEDVGEQLAEIANKKEQLKRSMAIKNAIVTNEIYPKLQASIMGNEYGSDVKSDFQKNNGAKFGKKVVMAQVSAEITDPSGNVEETPYVEPKTDTQEDNLPYGYTPPAQEEVKTEPIEQTSEPEVKTEEAATTEPSKPVTPTPQELYRIGNMFYKGGTPYEDQKSRGYTKGFNAFKLAGFTGSKDFTDALLEKGFTPKKGWSNVDEGEIQDFLYSKDDELTGGAIKEQLYKGLLATTAGREYFKKFGYDRIPDWEELTPEAKDAIFKDKILGRRVGLAARYLGMLSKKPTTPETEDSVKQEYAPGQYKMAKGTGKKPILPRYREFMSPANLAGYMVDMLKRREPGSAAFDTGAEMAAASLTLPVDENVAAQISEQYRALRGASPRLRTTDPVAMANQAAMLAGTQANINKIMEGAANRNAQQFANYQNTMAAVKQAMGKALATSKDLRITRDAQSEAAWDAIVSNAMKGFAKGQAKVDFANRRLNVAQSLYPNFGYSPLVGLQYQGNWAPQVGGSYTGGSEADRLKRENMYIKNQLAQMQALAMAGKLPTDILSEDVTPDKYGGKVKKLPRKSVKRIR